jgi:hypothetical protein
MGDVDLVWDDDLIWCPSQCYAPVEWPDGTPAVLYLRWRHDDPWGASIVTLPTRDTRVADPATTWDDVDIGWWRDDQLAEAKAAFVAVWEEKRNAQ